MTCESCNDTGIRIVAKTNADGILIGKHYETCDCQVVNRLCSYCRQVITDHDFWCLGPGSTAYCSPEHHDYHQQAIAIKEMIAASE
jgi:hypothetical protein